jgi:serum/glucocorticoid-regulated kinase 2
MNKNCDFLDLGDKKKFESERVLLSAEVLNFCKTVETVTMQFVVTKSKVFFVIEDAIQRDILIDDIEALTVSTSSDEFIIHVKGDSDERFSCQRNRSDILQMIIYLITYSMAPTNQDQILMNVFRKVRVFIVPDLSLDLYLTSDSDVEEGKTIRPNEKFLQLVCFKEYLEIENRFIEKKEERRKSARTIYSFSGNKTIMIEDFELIKTLGKGAHGKVLLCERRKFPGERYALKIIKKQHIIDANQLEHTIAEKIILSSLNHPFLVSLKYAFQTNQKIYFAMEFMKGGELFQHLKKVKIFQEEQAKFIVACLVLALGHLHNQDYIYRDLKPENILLDERGYAKLSDFGLAKELDVNGLARTFCGTPEYLAPEVILNNGCNRPADWWSLGVLVYEMLFGIPPFYSSEVQEMYKNTVLSPLKFRVRPKVSDEGKDFIAGLLVKNPTKRLGSVADSLEVMNHPWFTDFDWPKILDKKLTPPFNPSDSEWEKNFDPGFIKEYPKDSDCVIDSEKLREFQEQFKTFDFNIETENDVDDIIPHTVSQEIYPIFNDKNDGEIYQNKTDIVENKEKMEVEEDSYNITPFNEFPVELSMADKNNPQSDTRFIEEKDNGSSLMFQSSPQSGSSIRNPSIEHRLDQYQSPPLP